MRNVRERDSNGICDGGMWFRMLENQRSERDLGLLFTAPWPTHPSSTPSCHWSCQKVDSRKESHFLKIGSAYLILPFIQTVSSLEIVIHLVVNYKLERQSHLKPFENAKWYLESATFLRNSDHSSWHWTFYSWHHWSGSPSSIFPWAGAVAAGSVWNHSLPYSKGPSGRQGSISW